MFKRILVAVDGSQTGELALQTAIRLAIELQAQLRIVHAADIANINQDAEFPNRSRMAEDIVKNGQDILSGSEAIAASASVAEGVARVASKPVLLVRGE